MAPHLRKVEKEVLIPRYMEYKINHELCREESRIFSECAKQHGVQVVGNCKDLLKKFHDCSNKYFNDEELKKQMEKEYVEKREHYRKTGQPFEKSPFSRF